MTAPNPITHQPLHRVMDWPPALPLERIVIRFPSTAGDQVRSSPANRGPVATHRQARTYSDRAASLWLPLFGAASGMVWAGLLSPVIGWGWWIVLPVIVGTAFGFLLRR